MRWIPLFLVTIFSSSPASAQYLFSLLQTKDGLSSNSATALLRDADGFIWIGTANGLNRFDGSTIKIFNWAHGNYPLHRSEIIVDMVEITPANFLISTRNGLTRFLPHDQSFHEIAHHSSVPENPLETLNIQVDPDGKIWISTIQGLFIYKQDTLYAVSEIFPSLKLLNDDFFFTGFAAIDTFRHGIWLSTRHGLYFVDYTTGDYQSHEKNPHNLPVFRDSPTGRVVIQAASGDIWWNDEKDLLLRYSTADKSVQHFRDQFGKYGQYAIKSLFVDSGDRAWYSTWAGICLVLEPTGNLNVLPGEVKDQYGLVSGFMHDMMEEPSGDLWFATEGGAARLFRSNAIQRILDVPVKYGTINSMHRLDDQHILVSSNTDLVIFDTEKQVFELTKPESQKEKWNRVFNAELIDDEWWCATSRGIQIYNPVTNSFRLKEFKTHMKEILSSSVIEVMQDSRKNIWFSSWGGIIYRYEPSTGIIIKFDGTDPRHGDISRGVCQDFEEDEHGKIWIAYADKGLRVFDYTSELFKKITNHKDFDVSVVTRFVETGDQHMWATTWGNGLFKLDLQGNVTQKVTTEHGLMSNYTSGVFIDPEGRVWVGTPESVHYFNPASSLVNKVNFDMGYSLGDDFVYFMTDDSMMYASIRDRMLVINRNLLDKAIDITAPLISGFQVNGKPFPISALNEAIELKYNENFFNIDYSSTRHLEFPALQYAYMLQGFNPDWIPSGRNLTASFTNVPPGDYVFRVKSSDQNGVFNETDQHITIVVRPPFWQTTWFYMLCAACFLWLMYVVYKFVRRRHEKKKADTIIDYFANSFYSENAVNEICWDIAKNCISQLGFEDCGVYLMDQDRNALVEKAALGSKNPKGNELANPEIVPVGYEVIGNVAKDGKPLLISDTTKEVNASQNGSKHHSRLVVPILHEQKVIGVIDASHEQRHFFTHDHIKTISTIASISSFKIADAQAGILARENAMKLMEMNTLFAESQLKALRAQMNPHFVFNCLNSIQECIVMKKYNEASAYLNKFAKLFRLVLNNSGKLLITIDEEVEILTLYLELEQMRFDQGFRYSIEIDPEIESDDVLMPSMFLQPIVENALWHGLMHKQGDRQLDISFRKSSDETFSCHIEDNGVGRKKSAELKSKKIFNHSYESKGMKMNMERLEVLRRQGYHATLEFQDKESRTGDALGTHVIAEFSNNLNYN